jgi:hypothetical protein
VDECISSLTLSHLSLKYSNDEANQYFFTETLIQGAIMQDAKILVEVDRKLAERFKDLTMKGAFGSPEALTVLNFNELINRLLYKAILMGDQRLIGKQKKRDQAAYQRVSLKAASSQMLRFTRERQVIRPLEVIN